MIIDGSAVQEGLNPDSSNRWTEAAADSASIANEAPGDDDDNIRRSSEFLACLQASVSHQLKLSQRLTNDSAFCTLRTPSHRLVLH